MSFIENIKRLCIADFPIEGLAEEQIKLHSAVKLFLDSDEKQSEILLRELLAGSCDDEIRNIAAEILFSILIWQDRFDELNAFGFPRNNEEAEQVMIYDIRDAEMLLSPEAVVADMPDFPWIQPVMTVQINGKSCDLLIDTGALATIVTASVVEHCNLTVEEKTIGVEAATEGTLAAQAARIDELTIGRSIIKGKRCVIIPDDALDFSAVGGPKIDGLIGWEVIKYLHWEIDYQNRKIKVRASIPEDVKRNMCCDFFPMVKMTINEDETIVAGFDTGGIATNWGKSMVARISGAEQGEREMIGAGQSEPSLYSGYEVQAMSVDINDTQIVLQNAFILADSEYSKGRTLVQAGALGSDAARGKILVIDYPNRFLGIR